MSKHRIIWLAIACAFALVVSIGSAGAQSGAASGLYQIISGTYDGCCGFGGDIRSSLPNESQSFIRLTVDPQRNTASLTFLGEDLRKAFSIAPCPAGEAINFSFDQGLVFTNRIVFHVDPGPPPYAVYWNYSVSNSTDRLRIEGTLGMAQQNCVDVPTRFSHSNVVAVLMPGPNLRITEFSKEGALLFVQGRAGWTNVIEASTDLVTWTSISTNLMPATLCPVCPYILYRDAASTNAARRFYRCFELP
jgi:hypothetical protein